MENTSSFAAGRRLDVICLGRLAVDLYARNLGSPLEQVASFNKYLGGSSANIAFGTARLGLKSAMLSRVGDEQFGRFLLDTLAAEGCDTSQVRLDPEHLTGLAFLAIKDRNTFPLLFYREHCADMALCEDDIDEQFIAASKSLLITGTHLSTPGVLAASLKGLKYARRHNVRTVLDIDYRPVLWGLTGKADGETRYIRDQHVSAHLQAVLPWFDLVVGTEEEFLIAGGADDLMSSLQTVRKITPAVLVVKRGALGCSILPGQAEVPATLDMAFTEHGVQVEVLNVLGAGDAFLSGFLSAWLQGENYRECAQRANACGAIVVSRHGCAPAMPSLTELGYFRQHAERLQRPGDDAVLNRLHRSSVPRRQWQDLCIFAFDHRHQFYEMACAAGATEDRIPVLKQLLLQAVEQTAMANGLEDRVGVLVDDRYGQDALYRASGRGWWVGRPVELPQSDPLQFDHGPSVGSTLQDWPLEHIVKCLLQYHPDDAVEHRLAQEATLKTLYQATRQSGHQLLLELIPPAAMPSGEQVVLRAMERIYNIGIYPDWWKLQSPTAAQWLLIDQLIAERDRYCQGVLLLGLHAPPEVLREGFIQARDSSSCRGFAVGRTLFHEPARAWLAGQIDDAALVSEARRNFEQLIELWQQAGRREAA